MNGIEAVFLALATHEEHCYTRTYVKLTSCPICSPYWDKDPDIAFEEDPTPAPRGDCRPGKGARKRQRG